MLLDLRSVEASAADPTMGSGGLLLDLAPHADGAPPPPPPPPAGTTSAGPIAIYEPAHPTLGLVAAGFIAYAHPWPGSGHASITATVAASAAVEPVEGRATAGARTCTRMAAGPAGAGVARLTASVAWAAPWDSTPDGDDELVLLLCD